MAVVSVVRLKRCLVTPAQETPHMTLDLSVLDTIPVLRCDARTLHVFRHGPEAAAVIRDALSRALVHYYPLAGRLKDSNRGCRLQVECSGDGVWFVEAAADCNLDLVNYFDDVSSIPYDILLPDQIPETHQNINPLVKMQVTQFACGGFVLGLIFCHAICDGLGAAQFLNAVGELARGFDQPSMAPVWHRDFCPTDPDPSQRAQAIQMPNLPPAIPNHQLEHVNVDIPMDDILKLKQKFHDVTGNTCSTFEILAAGFWRLRTRAVHFSSNTQVKLVFFANCRHLVNPPLPKGFYGNCFFPVTITTTCDSLAQASMVEVVKLIQESKKKLSGEFCHYLKGGHVKAGREEEDPFSPPLDYTTLFISEWGKLGFNQVDYQWGPPVHVVPVQGSSIIPVGIVGSVPLPNRGVRLMTWCVEETHRQHFIDQMANLTII